MQPIKYLLLQFTISHFIFVYLRTCADTDLQLLQHWPIKWGRWCIGQALKLAKEG